jgi:hypothetical protein
MDLNLVIIFSFVLVVTAIVMGTIATITKRGISLKEKQLELEIAHAKGGASGASDARLDQMEQRLRVLERIATDGGANVATDLAREIEALRQADGQGVGVPINLKERV